MVSSIQLGNFFSTGGKTVSGGAGGSGIDTQSLVQGLVDAKLIPATKLQDQITVNDAKSAAFVEFNTLLARFKDAASALRNPPGVANAADNAFKFRTATIASNTSVAGSDYVSVSATPGAAVQSYTIDNIISLAASKKQSTGDISIATADSAAVSDTPVAGEFKAGTFTLNGQDITLTAGETLNSVAAKFNAVSDNTGISASIVQVTTGQYQLSFSSTKTGTANDFDFNNISPAGTLVDASGVFGSVTITDKQVAEDAVFDLNGTTITRSKNDITDLVDGLTFTIKQTTLSAPTTSVNINIVADQEISKNSIIAFADAYDELKIFTAKQLELNADGTYKDTAILYNSGSFRAIMNGIDSQITSIVSGISGSNPSKLSDLGVTFTDQEATADTPRIRNMLTVNDTKLAAAIASDPDAVRKVFEFNFVTENTALRVISRTNALATSSFTMNIAPSTSTYQATYNDGTGNVTIDLDATAIVNSVTGLTTGYTLKGQSGTVLEGLVLLYASTADGTATVAATQGIADKVFNVADPAVKANTGIIAVELTSLKDADTRLTDNIAKINDQVEVYRQQLLDKFSRLEQAISNINTLLSSLQANDDTRNGLSN
jgi:flagellar hook-associated protein 2